MSRNREILLTFVVLTVGVACAGSLFISFGLSSSEAAAWAQAVGTVGAVFATGYYATQQINAQAKLRREDRVDLLRAMRQASDYAMDGFSSVDQALPNANVEALRLVVGVTLSKAWSSAFRQFLEIPVDRWPSPFLFVRAKQFIQAYDDFEQYIVQLVGFQQITDTEWKRAKRLRADVDAFLKLFETACDAQIARLS